METKKNFLPTLETLLSILDVCGSSVEEFFYQDIANYKNDKKIFDMLNSASQEKKDIIMAILKLK